MSDLFRYFFTNKAYIDVDLPGKMFSPLHIVIMVILIVCVPLAAFFLRKLSDRKLKIIFIAVWAAVSVLEVVKNVWYSLTSPNGFEATEILPLYLCSIFMFIMPFAIWAKPNSVLRRSACGFICTLNIVGGFSNFVYPATVLPYYSAISFAGLHTLIYHALIVFVALLMLFSGYYRYELKDAPLAFIPVAVFSVPVNIVNFTINADYMFFHGNFFPFSIIASQMPVWLWVIVLYIGYFLLPYFFYLPAHFIQKFSRKKAKQPENS